MREERLVAESEDVVGLCFGEDLGGVSRRFQDGCSASNDGKWLGFVEGRSCFGLAQQRVPISCALRVTQNGREMRSTMRMA